jgi:hypothetical protein
LGEGAVAVGFVEVPAGEVAELADELLEDPPQALSVAPPSRRTSDAAAILTRRRG